MQAFSAKLRKDINGLVSDRPGGISAAAMDGDNIEFLNTGEDAGPVSLYEIGSITKAFTGLLLALLERDGAVSRHQTVGDFLNLDFADPEVAATTLEELAAHTSGLPRLPDNLNPADNHDPYADYSAEDLCVFLSAYQLEEGAKGKLTYSNLGYGLLGYVLALAANRSYEELLTEKICEPLGMQDTHVNRPGSQHPLVRGHTETGKPAQNWHFTPAISGAGCLLSTPRDLSRFMRAQAGATDDPSLAEAIDRSHTLLFTPENGPPIAYAWRTIRLENGQRLIWLPGKTGGFSSYMAISIDSGFGVAVLSSRALDTSSIDKLFAEYVVAEANVG